MKDTVKIVGFDIGGANTDLAIIDFDRSGNIENIETDFEYLPMWMKKDELSMALLDLLGSYANDIDAVGISMTAELVDAYKTKKEGVMDVAKKSKDTFDVPVGFVGLDGIVDFNKLKEDPLKAAAANWIATAPIAAKIESNCIMIDTGSTTTDIIPIKNGKECAKGISDLERLKTGELIYSGTLRTNVATIVDKVPLDDVWIRVASELFAITADVHTVRGNIKKEDYSCNTPDGAGKSVDECMRRLSRVICGDMDVLSPGDIGEIAAFIHEMQVQKVSEALLEVSQRNQIDTVVTTGLGMDIIGKMASEVAGLNSVGMDQILKKDDCVVAPAVGTAILMEEYLRKV
ncbi:hydantoinase/oxoprolinase family protein [Methanobacterium paludis]|uniref:H4MPT-linked C1 transfer pathway protein n=1 Tax=Methanobacterium paludis (strain DSM 25820 / JCM 18151 / SWAN1) TaxID=868131 RepID=F6D6J3_METPW|nr:hydantoinase/oxoprolinase family protein [Methanobacterium paludis]AEG17706.1 H4MPT-linked C1 transfer pathway protein [Methanobacterium paludis]